MLARCVRMFRERPKCLFGCGPATLRGGLDAFASSGTSCKTDTTANTVNGVRLPDLLRLVASTSCVDSGLPFGLFFAYVHSVWVQPMRLDHFAVPI